VVTLTWKSKGATITYRGSDRDAQVESSSITPDGKGGFNAEGAVSSSIDLTKPAAQLVREFAEPNPQLAASDPATAAALRAINAGWAGTPRVLSAARAAGQGPIIDSWCAQNDWDGDDMHAKTCNVRRLDQQKGSGANLVNWLAEQTTGSAWSNDGQHGDPGCFNCDGIDKYYGMLYYYAPAGVVQIPAWEPNTTIKVQDSCRTVTTSIQGQSGASYSTSKTVCPDTLGPYGVGTQSSGSQWKGEGTSPGQYRGILFTLLARTKMGVQKTTLYHAVHIT
jgi:hypothetical protein